MPSFDHQIMIRKPLVVIEKPFMQLKDYLLDDPTSCSSNGFKSFPRKPQCYSTVRLLLEIDLKQKDHNGLRCNRILRRRRRSKTASAKVSVLQRASDAVINAVKHLPYTKLLKSRFWGKSDGNEERPTLDRCSPSDQNTESMINGDKSKSTVSWCEVEFGNSEALFRSFTSSGRCSTASCSVRNDVVGSENNVSLRKVNEDTTVCEDSSTQAESPAMKEWPNEEEKEQQFSPMSILDCPFEEDDHDDRTRSSNFLHKLAHFEGAKQKILQKIQRFENLVHLEPVDLEKRIAISDDVEDNKLATFSIQKDNDLDKRIKSEEKSREITKLVENKNDYLGSKADNLVFDYFKERSIEERKENKLVNEEEDMKVMEDWMNGEKRDVLLSWDMTEGRKAYEWKKRFDGEKEEIGLDLEAYIWDSLVHDLLIDVL